MLIPTLIMGALLGVSVIEHVYLMHATNVMDKFSCC